MSCERGCSPLATCCTAVQASKVRKLAEGLGPSSPPGGVAMHKALEDNFECVVRTLHRARV